MSKERPGGAKGIGGMERWNVVLILQENKIRTSSYRGKVDQRDEIDRDFERLTSPRVLRPVSPTNGGFAVKKRIKLPSFRVETFAAFHSSLLSFLSFPHSFFFQFRPRDPFYLFYPLDSRSTLSHVVGLPSPSQPLIRLLFLLFPARSCFSPFS